MTEILNKNMSESVIFENNGDVIKIINNFFQIIFLKK